MPTIRNHASGNRMRLMGLGDPGTGKTGSLVEVIDRMDELGIERVIIQDWDDGLDILAKRCKPDNLDKVFYETLRDEMKATPLGPIPRGIPESFTKGMRLLNSWKDKEVDLGTCNTWGPETLFVCDSLTGMGDAAKHWVMHLDNELDDWRATGKAMTLQDKYVQLCMSMRCNVIIFAHIRYMGGGGVQVTDMETKGEIRKEMDSDAEGQGFPSALGRILPRQIGRHFNTTLEWKIKAQRRTIRTVPEDRITLKCPVHLPQSLTQEGGLFQVIQAFKGE